jgi:predicted DNA-binding transcriptional regulator YafY
LLHTAIHKHKQVTFKYYEYNQHKIKEYKHRRHIYIFSPYALLWNNDRYYAVGFSDKHNKVISFRVDRIASPKLTDKPAIPRPADFDISMYSQSIFQMYEGEGLQKVTLKCENNLMKNVIDRFGVDIETEIIDDEHFAATVEVSASPTFYGWVFLFGGRMKIVSPDTVIAEYQALVRKAIE